MTSPLEELVTVKACTALPPPPCPTDPLAVSVTPFAELTTKFCAETWPLPATLPPVVMLKEPVLPPLKTLMLASIATPPVPLLKLSVPTLGKAVACDTVIAPVALPLPITKVPPPGLNTANAAGSSSNWL